MKKILLRTGILTIGNLAILADDLILNVEEKIPQIMVSVEQYEQKLHNEELVRKYANVYEIDEEVVVSKLKEITGNFSNYDWNYGYGIDENKKKNQEIELLTIVRDIYKNPEKYDLKREDLGTDKEYEPNEYCEDLVLYYSELLGVNKEIAMSIVYAECGNELNSSNYLNNNNPAGMGPHNYYNNIEHGVIEFIFLLKNSYGCILETDASFFYTMGPIYCTVGYDNWINNTLGYYNNLIEDYYYYAYDRGYKKVLK